MTTSVWSRPAGDRFAKAALGQNRFQFIGQRLLVGGLERRRKAQMVMVSRRIVPSTISGNTGSGRDRTSIAIARACLGATVGHGRPASARSAICRRVE